MSVLWRLNTFLWIHYWRLKMLIGVLSDLVRFRFMDEVLESFLRCLKVVTDVLSSFKFVTFKFMSIFLFLVLEITIFCFKNDHLTLIAIVWTVSRCFEILTAFIVWFICSPNKSWCRIFMQILSYTFLFRLRFYSMFLPDLFSLRYFLSLFLPFWCLH